MSATSNIPDYYVVSEKSRLCLEKNNIDYSELWITPLRDGYRIEVFPAPSTEEIKQFLNCISRELGVDSIVEHIVKEPLEYMLMHVKWSVKR